MRGGETGTVPAVVVAGCPLEPQPAASSARATSAAIRFMLAQSASILSGVSVVAVVLLAAAVVLLAAAEWPRLSGRVGAEAWQGRRRAKRKAQFRVVESDPDESDEFARSVERDLAALPTIDPKKR
jgi:hypothetical protein